MDPLEASPSIYTPEDRENLKKTYPQLAGRVRSESCLSKP